MRKLILEEWVSLDGYVEDQDGKLDFFRSLDPEQNKHSEKDQLKFLEHIDTILLGRKTYQLFVEFWPGANSDQEIIAGKLNSIPKLVFSNTLKQAPWGKWPEAGIVAGNASAEIKKLKDQPGKDMVLWGSISLAQSLIKDNLVDEYHLQLCPVLLGGGRSLFGDINKNFELSAVRQYETGVIFLNYLPKDK